MSEAIAVAINKNFVSADTTKIAEFEKQGKEAIKEFNKIKEEFGRINGDLLAVYKGVGADAYKYETDNILEKIGSVKDVLNAITESMSGIRSTYSEFDDELGESNRSLIPAEEGE